MKRARPKGKAKAIKSSKKAVYKEKPIKSGESVVDANTGGAYDSIIDEIQSEKRGEKKPIKKKKSNGNGKKVLSVILIILLAFIVIAMGTNLFDDDDILAPLEDGKINVLLLGVDESGLRTDAIMVASYDVNEGQVNLLSIPRDTKVYITNKKATRKINAVHAMTSESDNKKILGVQATAEAVTQLTGIPINYYIEFSFLSIDHLFDSLGGVTYDVPDVEGKGRGMNYDDPYQNLHIQLKPGVQTLTGNQVQQFLRYRKSKYGVGTGSDTDRVKRQQDFIKAVIDQKLNIGLITKIPSIYSQLSKEIKTNISMVDITKYIRHLNKILGENIKSYSLVGENKTIGGASYFVCNLAATKALITENFGIDEEVTDKITLSGKSPQTPLKAGNMSKSQTVTKEPPKTEEKIEKVEETPKEEEKKEEKEVDKKEEKSETPPVTPNETPLEDIYNLD
ncbi:MAG: LCP family protein [Clostridia bacterium]|nr:LCP family protein [Clostridia bacterium]